MGDEGFSCQGQPSTCVQTSEDNNGLVFVIMALVIFGCCICCILLLVAVCALWACTRPPEIYEMREYVQEERIKTETHRSETTQSSKEDSEMKASYPSGPKKILNSFKESLTILTTSPAMSGPDSACLLLPDQESNTPASSRKIGNTSLEKSVWRPE